MNFENTYKTLRRASEKLAQQNALQKNVALLKVAQALDEQREKILSANKTDVENARAK